MYLFCTRAILLFFRDTVFTVGIVLFPLRGTETYVARYRKTTYTNRSTSGIDLALHGQDPMLD